MKLSSPAVLLLLLPIAVSCLLERVDKIALVGRVHFQRPAHLVFCPSAWRRDVRRPMCLSATRRLIVLCSRQKKKKATRSCLCASALSSLLARVCIEDPCVASSLFSARPLASAVTWLPRQLCACVWHVQPVQMELLSHMSSLTFPSDARPASAPRPPCVNTKQSRLSRLWFSLSCPPCFINGRRHLESY